MKTLHSVNIEPVFVTEFMPDWKEFEQNKIYISEQYKSALHLCLCGCGEKVSTPITEGMWNLIKENNGSISLTPSIGNYQFNCKSHYIITKNKANFV